MLAATAKIGSKYLVHVEILKALGTELENLPEKEKVMFDFKSAVVFLRPFLELAIKKNYTKDEIFQLMGKVGWSITQNTFKYFWSLFLLEEETSGKKKSITKTPKKSKISTAITSVEDNELQSLNNQDNAEQLNKTEISDFNTQTSNAVGDKTQMSFNETLKSEKIAENPTQKSSAHFDLPPDTEDL